MIEEFSFRTRTQNLQKLKERNFDFLIIGGGITGAAVAKEASQRGFTVALVEKHDFAYGTSSRSSKLIHGGLRYLENFEFKLVFEALGERAWLLKKIPELVKPLVFFLPVYQSHPRNMKILSLGLWLYDFLSLFRSYRFHKKISKEKFLKEFPFLKQEGLLGGFTYYDALMWDDGLVVETLRQAHCLGASIANYVEATSPIWQGERIVGFRVKDLEQTENAEISIHANTVISCVGPWTDELGVHVSQTWKAELNPSKGVHIVFDFKKVPVPGALIMSHPSDGRVAFVIPRKDLGDGVVIVGTTDGPTPLDPEKATIEKQDIEYLLNLLGIYFPDLNLSVSDVISAYVGVRPLLTGTSGSEGQNLLQKVSREHVIWRGQGGVVFVAGGKYTTHRKMAQEIIKVASKDYNFGNNVKPSLKRQNSITCQQT
ncbi:MAG: glycerol-3-phosphate dehydrogenase/oxidase [Deltaproteobacteria bacterium]|nr:glycerol-3-phosphate dehydrogenase/oxidase [Deltaproteobacteria bacterium]